MALVSLLKSVDDRLGFIQESPGVSSGSENLRRNAGCSWYSTTMVVSSGTLRFISRDGEQLDV